MPLSVTLSRRQTLVLKLDKDKLKNELEDHGFSKDQIEFTLHDILSFLQEHLVIEIDNTRSLAAPLRIAAPQCINISRKNKTSSSGL